MKIGLIISILAVLVLGTISFIGITAAKPYEATLMTVIHKPQPEVYNIMTNIWVFPLLFNQAVKVELLEIRSNNSLTWVEYDARNKPWIYELTGRNSSNSISISILSNRMYEYGSWLVEVRGDSNTSYISITEDSKFRNWWYQFRGLALGRNTGLKMKIENVDKYFVEEKY